MSDVQAWHETPGARLRACLGVADADVAVRARELLDAAEMEHRARYGTAPAPRQWPWEAGLAAAAVEQFKVTPVNSYELAERWNSQDPLNRVGVAPEGGSTGFAMRVFVNGRAQYTGDPRAIEQMKESFAADARRRAAAQGRLDATAHTHTPYNVYKSVQ